MKKSMLNLVAAACLAAFGGVSCAAVASCVTYNHEIETTSEDYLEENHAVSGMFFSTDYVVEEYEYDDAYCIVYDDADANMFEVEICVDLETYQIVRKAISEKHELVGQLVLNEDESTDDFQVFTYMPEPEFEMAEASAKL